MVVIQRVIDDLALSPSPHQPMIAQEAKLVGDRCSIHAGGGGEISDAKLPGAERDQHLDPGWVAEDREERRHLPGSGRVTKHPVRIHDRGRMQAITIVAPGGLRFHRLG